MKKKIKLGDEVKDIITGFKGIAISKINYLNGCIQYGVKARVELAALKEAEYIDESQIKWVGHGVNPKPVIEKEASSRPGGDQPDRPREKRSQRKSYYAAHRRN